MKLSSCGTSSQKYLTIEDLDKLRKEATKEAVNALKKQQEPSQGNESETSTGDEAESHRRLRSADNSQAARAKRAGLRATLKDGEETKEDKPTPSSTRKRKATATPSSSKKKKTTTPSTTKKKKK